MGKRLILIRHAKADWDSTSGLDIDRPLHRRGHTEAQAMAAHLAANLDAPDAVWSSPSQRTLATANYFMSAWHLPANGIIPDARIYEARVQDLLECINSMDAIYHTVALFGHNPGISDFAAYLSEDEVPPMDTCAVLVLDFSIDDWALVSRGTGKLAWSASP